jgi:hypothetical protein
VPNLYAHDSFEIAHMTAFSAFTLRQALLQAGFEVLAVEKHGRPRSALLPLYLTVLASPGGGQAGSLQVRPERYVSLKRRLGMLARRVLSKVFPRRAWIPMKQD